jgi:hypothetical protein
MAEKSTEDFDREIAEVVKRVHENEAKRDAAYNSGDYWKCGNIKQLIAHDHALLRDLSEKKAASRPVESLRGSSSIFYGTN